MTSDIPASQSWLAVYAGLLGCLAALSHAYAGSLALEFPLLATTSVLFGIAMAVRGGAWLARYRPASPLGVLRSRIDALSADIAVRFAVFQSSTLFFIWMPPIKRAIPNANGYWADSGLVALERYVFGTDPWALLHHLPDWVTPGIDAIYASWIVLIVLISMLIAVFGPTALLARYYLAWAMAWVVLGIGVAHLIPSAGPIFGPDLGFGFEGLHRELKGTAALRFHDMLWSMHVSGSGDLGGGISAMPSMHCALTAIFVAAAWRSRWRPLALLYAALIWFGSVYLGWHYALDGVISAIGIALIWRLCGKLTTAGAALVPTRRARIQLPI